MCWRCYTKGERFACACTVELPLRVDWVTANFEELTAVQKPCPLGSLHQPEGMPHREHQESVRQHREPVFECCPVGG